MILINREIAKEIFEKKIVTIQSFDNVDFYDLSWIWFGVSFYADILKQEAENGN